MEIMMRHKRWGFSTWKNQVTNKWIWRGKAKQSTKSPKQTNDNTDEKAQNYQSKKQNHLDDYPKSRVEI